MREDLIERLRKLEKAARERAENSRVIADYLAPELEALHARTGHNIYAARMAVDHKNSARTDAAEADTLAEAAAALAGQQQRDGTLE